MEGYVYQVVFNNDYFSKGKSDFIFFFLFEIFLDVTCSLGGKNKNPLQPIIKKKFGVSSLKRDFKQGISEKNQTFHYNEILCHLRATSFNWLDYYQG